MAAPLPSRSYGGPDRLARAGGDPDFSFFRRGDQRGLGLPMAAPNRGSCRCHRLRGRRGQRSGPGRAAGCSRAPRADRAMVEDDHRHGGARRLVGGRRQRRRPQHRGAAWARPQCARAARRQGSGRSFRDRIEERRQPDRKHRRTAPRLTSAVAARVERPRPFIGAHVGAFRDAVLHLRPVSVALAVGRRGVAAGPSGETGGKIPRRHGR